MARYPTGQPVRLSATVRDTTGTLVNAGTLVLTVQAPDSTTISYNAPTNDSTGLYHQDVPATDLTQVGHYQYKWVSTGTGAGVSLGDFDVFDPFEPAILNLTDAKLALNIPAATTTQDAEIQAMVDTVTATVENFIGGPAEARTVSEWIRIGTYRSITVRQRPLISVTSITDNATGVAIPITDLDIDTNAGIIRRKLYLPFWPTGTSYTVVYTAGYSPIPAAFNVAARIILQHMWETQRGSQRPLFPGDDVMQPPGMAYSVPNRAMELLAPYAYEAYV